MGQVWREFASPEGLAEAFADDVAQRLEATIRERGAASLAVSGGTTPKQFFRALSRKPIAWEKVTVTLVDERFVPPTHERSNEKLVREILLTRAARSARFLPLYSDTATPEDAAEQTSALLAKAGLPLDVAVLGMGTDGHTASIFPDASIREALLDPASRKTVMAVHAPSAGEPRLTLPLARIVDARHLALHIEGREKRRVLENALEQDAALPIADILRHAPHAEVWWAPAKDEIR